MKNEIIIIIYIPILYIVLIYYINNFHLFLYSLVLFFLYFNILISISDINKQLSNFI